MRRLIIFGGTASGKTTVAKILSNKLDIPCYSTDDIVYKHNWKKKRVSTEKEKIVKKILTSKNWIIEGVHTEVWLLPVIKKADLVILLDLPRVVLLKRVLKRQLLKRNFKHIFKLFYYAWIYKKDHFIWHKNVAIKFNKKLVIFHTNKQIKQFTDSFTHNKE
jgi:adenylate kinase family enzyme